MLPALLLILLGVGAGIIAYGYDIGSFTSMGPGFFPLVLGIELVLLCALVLWRDRPAVSKTPQRSKPTVPAFAWRPFCAVSAGILAWALLAESAGFFIAAVCQVVITALALPAPRWRGILIMAGLLAVGGYLLFVVQLGVPLEAMG